MRRKYLDKLSGAVSLITLLESSIRVSVTQQTAAESESIVSAHIEVAELQRLTGFENVLAGRLRATWQ